MPSDFHRLRNVSMPELLKSTGYLEHPTAMTEQVLEDAFRANPKFVEQWATVFDDQRSRHGWSLQENQGEWIVDYPNRRKYQTFPDGASACAVVVKRQIEQYRESLGG
jgi:hypothetical protein